MENIENLKFMSIGGNCEDIVYLGKDRIRGPVDNVVGRKGLLTIKNLFENRILDVINETPWKLEPRKPDFPGDSEITYLLSDYRIVHNDPRTDKYKEEMKKRFMVFIDFYKKLRQDPNYFFTYSLNYFDVSEEGILSEKFFEGIEYLKSLKLLDKVIFIGVSNSTVKFWNFYPKDYNLREHGIKYIELSHFTMREKEDSIHQQFLEKIKLL